MTTHKNLEQLLQIWEQAIADHQADASAVRSAAIAESAMSRGAYFDDVYKSNDLFRRIHNNFGALEAPGPDSDSDNRELWQEQIRLVTEARAKYTS